MGKALRKHARGAPCSLNLPRCAPGPENETVVLAHHKGGGVKSDDMEAVTACYSCHTLLDGAESDLLLLTGESYEQIFERAKAKTHRYWRSKRLI